MTRATLNQLMFAVITGTLPEPVTRAADVFAESVIEFNEPKRVGRFSFFRREYLRKPLQCYSDEFRQIVLCFGTRTGKTTVIYAGAAFRVSQCARRVLFVKPGAKGTAGAESDARTRFMPMLRATPALASLIPRGAIRHNFKTAQQMLLNGSIIDWTGSNSVANLSGNSMEDVYQDEIDKFNATRRKDTEGNEVEADAVDLADERAREFEFAKLVKASTPTLSTGRIWTELMKTDVQRRHVPCPLCGRHHPSSRLVVIAWSREFTVLPKKYADGRDIPLAYVAWDKEAKRRDGTWDLERVEKSAGYLCPHCGGRFMDAEKPWMDANGEWKATKVGAPRSIGFHLPSMYASHDQTTAGKLSVEFLQKVKSLAGPQSFINSVLAEPNESQSSAGKRTELILSRIESVKEWRKLMTIDCQAKSNPVMWNGLKDATGGYFYFVIRAHAEKESHAIRASGCDTWDDLKSAQTSESVKDIGVFIDSGWGARDESEVYRQCARNSEILRQAVGKAMCIGWIPTKGMPSRKRWRDQETGLYLPYYLRSIDPFEGTAESGNLVINLLEFAAELFKDILANMRKGMGGYKWSVEEEVATETYWRHLDGQHKVTLQKFNGVNESKWMTRHKDWPDHLYACEYGQVAAASFLQILPIETIIEKK